MRRIPMQPIWTVSKGRRILVPGGWSGFIPEMIPSPADEAVYAEVFFEDFRGDLRLAKEAAREALMREYSSCRVWKLTLAVGYWVRKYVKLYPDTLKKCSIWENPEQAKEEYYVAQGFDPQRIQLCYLPFDNTGRAGKPYANRLLAEMYEARKGVSHARGDR